MAEKNQLLRKNLPTVKGAPAGGCREWCVDAGCKTLLDGGLEHVLFFHILGRIIPTDELIFFRGVGQPPTSIESFLLFYWA